MKPKLKKGLILFLAFLFLIIRLFGGIYKDDEFQGKIFFIKHKPSWKWSFYSPRAMSDMTLEEMSEKKKKEQIQFDEFIPKRIWEFPANASFQKIIISKPSNEKIPIMDEVGNSTDSSIETSEENFCSELHGEMMTGEECFYPNKTIDEVYDKLLHKKDLNDVEFLRQKVPAKNQRDEINENGLISIDYQRKENNYFIEMFYHGGVTTIELNQLEKGVRTRIILSAD
ncbi:hypothetical protein [Moheibacter stercoris]|uniref:Uncharacterized protein n=1 Tax=Moheibacter stercoris TaxID=1628251 RepID=A0ABV2LPL8_9FLAO